MRRTFQLAFAAFTFLATGLSAFGPAHAAFEKKVALVVGNGAYRNAPTLANPVGDAKAIAETFRGLGFEVVEGYDADRSTLSATVREFAKSSRDADLSVFFYAGHGIAHDGRNYMVPVDAAFEDTTALDFEAMPVDFVTKQMSYADGVSLVFLDACRDNPLAGTLARSLGLSTRGGATRGLAQMDVRDAGKGLAIAFATSPGEVAYDGGGSHSPFTEALLKHLDTPEADFTEVMSRVTGEVLRATDERQRPWLNASLTGSVVLNPVEPAPEPSTPQPSAAAPGLEAETLLFNLARESGDASDYRAYLQKFPEGLYAYNAKLTLELLEDQAPATVRSTADAGEAGEAAEPDRASAADTNEAATGAAAPDQVAALAEPERTASDGDGGLVIGPAAGDSTAAVPDSSEVTEAALGMDRTKRREVQDRLNVAGSSVGGADGIFGPRTRAGLSSWQEENGFEATGYLNAAQLAALTSATATAFAALLDERAEARAAARNAEKARAARARKQRSARRKASAPKTATQRATRRQAPAATRAAKAQPTKPRAMRRRAAEKAPAVVRRRKPGDITSGRKPEWSIGLGRNGGSVRFGY